MRAEMIRIEQGFEARFTRQLQQERKTVWDMLTDNDKLKQWFPELKIGELKKGGSVILDMEDGRVENMTITDLEIGQKMTIDWGKGNVRFELAQRGGGTELRLFETIHKVTADTAKDLARWHVCLNAMQAVLDDQEIQRKEEWNYWHSEYKRLVESMTVSFE